MTELPFLLGLLLALALLLRMDFVFYVVYVLAGVWLLARWATPRSLGRLEVRREFTDHAFLGETVEVTLRLRNLGRLPVPWLRVVETLPIALAAGGQLRRALSLRPREETTVRYALRCVRRGYYPIGPLQLTGGDLFGFAQAQARSEGADYLTVYPRIVPLARADLPSQLPFGALASPQRMFEDPARMRGVRTYQPGDSLRRIHWKASAHSDDLLVKQLSPAISLETLLLLDLNQAEYSRQRGLDAAEWAIVVAASLAVYLEQARQAVGLAVYGADGSPAEAAVRLPPPLPPRPGRPHLMKVLSQLARAELHPLPEPFAAWAPRAAAALGWGATAVAIAPHGDEALCRSLHTLVRRGLNVALLIVDPAAEVASAQRRARSLGFAAFPVTTERELEQWQARPRGHSPRQQRSFR
ncbi:MAG: DUF58 domain-containing protein [Anaerolineae bacterium]|nr:DUF58 domain-containing protein [Anaerolineae bacterium]